MKFTFEGGITFPFHKVNEDRKIMKFILKDTGIAIKDEHKPKLFSTFGMMSEERDINQNRNWANHMQEAC
jgi:hypothetical protein